MRRLGSPAAIGGIGALLLLLTACVGGGQQGPAAAPDGGSGARIEATGEVPSYWAVGEQAPPLSVIVYDEHDLTVADEQVTFRISAGPAQLADGLFVTETGTDGVATVHGIVPESAGEIGVEVATARLLTTLTIEAK